MAKRLYGVAVGHPFRNTVKTIMFLKSRLGCDEKQEGLIGQERESKDIPMQSSTHGRDRRPCLFLLCQSCGWQFVCEHTRAIPLSPDGYAALKEHGN